MEISVCIAHIPTRVEELQRAIDSLRAQTLQPALVQIETDDQRTGAAATKNRALARVETPWVSWLDDDDWAHPNHLELLAQGQAESGADVVYSWPEMDGAPDPRPDRFGLLFDADELRRGSYLHTTMLVRTDLAKAVGGFQCPPGSQYDDWGFALALLDAGASFWHVARRTWTWTVNGRNTSGLATRW